MGVGGDAGGWEFRVALADFFANMTTDFLQGCRAENPRGKRGPQAGDERIDKMTPYLIIAGLGVWAGLLVYLSECDRSARRDQQRRDRWRTRGW